MNYTATLDGWGANPATPDNILLGASSRIYSSVTGNGRSSLIAKGWTITDSAPDGGVCAASALPVVFSSISAVIKDSRLVVNWATLSETNNDHFDVEISNDGFDFISIGSLVSKAKDGNSETIIEYTFSKTIHNVSLLGSSAFVLGLAFLVVGRKNKILLMVFGVAGFVGINAGCNKQNYIKTNSSNNVYVRVAQIDKDGLKTYGRVIKARMDEE
ncbi:hypothetical protein [Niabella hibiscisoli]|uniref:hypothetical protein n=1 Tax=Niabella hibiscisoli TaxID=1825928 RepID=UPI001F0F6231|nr:hypothetical protein [Niabella hibiscisoli]MCH5718430.1 hypothetical protein [Niabella hibiscisoli]